jgi:CRISPR-associated endonuclease Cas1
MRSKATSPLVYTANRGAVCVADGYHVTVRVRHGRLIVEDGFGPDRRRREYTRVTAPIVRLVVVGNGGSISLEALCWLRDVGAALIHVARDGRLITTTTAEVADAKLRRAQSFAASSDVGLGIARYLLAEKVAGQRRVLQLVTDEAELLGGIDEAAERLQSAATIEHLVWAERDAALAYWAGWSNVEVRFQPRDRDNLPEHWLRFGQRSSPLTGGPRLATNPANALLNYLYTLLEAEARLACLTVGLDPTIGIVHADARSRDSLALDLMEAVRPAVDDHVLTLLRQGTFRATDFVETRQGACRIQAPLTEQLGRTTTQWREMLGPIVEAIPRILTGSTLGSRSRPTPLTRANHAASRAPVRRRQLRPIAPMPTCKRCGGELPSRRRVYCDVCLPIFRQEQLEASVVRVSAVEVIKARGVDTTHGGVARQRRGLTNAARKAKIREWEKRHGKRRDLDTFERDVLPRIQNVSLSRLRRATGLSLRYVSQIRRGEKTPHPMHWEALRTA